MKDIYLSIDSCPNLPCDVLVCAVTLIISFTMLLTSTIKKQHPKGPLFLPFTKAAKVSSFCGSFLAIFQ